MQHPKPKPLWPYQLLVLQSQPLSIKIILAGPYDTMQDQYALSLSLHHNQPDAQLVGTCASTQVGKSVRWDSFVFGTCAESTGCRGR